MAKNIKPIGERIIIKPQEIETKTSSGIFIPESAKEKQNTGEVIAVGKLEDNEIKVGDNILYSKNAGTEISLNEEKLIILEKNDILAVI